MLRRVGLAALVALATAASGATAADQNVGPQCANSAGNLDQQIAACTADIKSGRLGQDGRATALYNRAVAYGRRGDYANALADINEVIRLKPQLAAAYTTRGLSYSSVGDFAHAVADFDQAIRLSPQDARPFLQRGVARSSLGDLTRAIADFTESLRLDPRNFIALMVRGQAYVRLSDYPRAIADFDEYIRLRPQDRDGYFHRGAAYRRLGDAAHADADFQRSIQLTDEQAAGASALSVRCLIRIETDRDLDGARALCEQAISATPDPAQSAPVFGSLGMIALKQQRWQDAWNAFDRYARSVPNSPIALFGRGIAALRLGRASEGQADIAAARARSAGVDQVFAVYGVTP